MLPALPERNLVFKGLVTDKEDMNKLMLTPLIRYPLQGGSALITFEKAEGKSKKSAATGSKASPVQSYTLSPRRLLLRAPSC